MTFNVYWNGEYVETFSSREEALDGDETERLVKHLRNQINFIEGNLTEAEYLELEK